MSEFVERGDTIDQERRYGGSIASGVERQMFSARRLPEQRGTDLCPDGVKDVLTH